MLKNQGMTLVEVIAVITVAVIVIALAAVVSMMPARGRHRLMQPNTQLYSIHQAMLIYVDDSDGEAGYDAHMVHQGVDVDHD